MLPVAANAQSTLFGDKGRDGVFKSQTSVLDRRAATQYAASVRLQPTTFETKTLSSPAFRGKYNGPYLAMARAAARLA